MLEQFQTTYLVREWQQVTLLIPLKESPCFRGQCLELARSPKRPSKRGSSGALWVTYAARPIRASSVSLDCGETKAKRRLFPRFVFTGKTGKCNDTKPWDPSWYGRVNSRVKWESGRWYISKLTIDYSIKFFDFTINVVSMSFYTIFRCNANVRIHDLSAGIDRMDKCTPSSEGISRQRCSVYSCDGNVAGN
jgi:hypothetical protein